MFVLNAEIRIGDKVLRRIHDVEIEHSTEKIGAKATIQVPTTARLIRNGETITEIETTKAFRVGDEVNIMLGYDSNLRQEFVGYVNKILPGVPLEIECQDSIFLLRRKNLKGSFERTTLKSLLQVILEGTEVSLGENVPDIHFEHFYFRNVSAANALQKLKENYGLIMYFIGKNLQVGLRHESDGTEVKYDFGKNIIHSSLEWIEEEDVRLKVKVVNWKRDNTKTEIEIGDDDGEQRTLYFYDIPDEAQLQKVAEGEMEKMKYSGYKGNIETFLLPVVSVGNVAILNDSDFPERSGRYLVHKVTTNYGMSGGRRKVELGIKI